MIPAKLDWLFCDVDPMTIGLDEQCDHVIERIMVRGDWDAMRWLIHHCERDVLASFLHRKGHRLTPRERAFWSLIADVPYKAVPSGRQSSWKSGGRPSWAGMSSAEVTDAAQLQRAFEAWGRITAKKH